MTKAEKDSIVEVAAWCVKRLRDEEFKKRPDYETAAEEVAIKLGQFLDGLRKIKSKE
ncbi:MAG TPA: hypothetical protein VKB24_09985 [Candidatus Acidoferrum sp.]|nr:hypothetical protein [Candidatus Acidoferrum sp.]